MENYILELSPTLPQLAGLEQSFYSFYVCTAVRKFFFFLDPMRTGRWVMSMTHTVRLPYCISHIIILLDNKRECVFLMIIWPAFRMGQYRANDHPYHAPQFIWYFFDNDGLFYNNYDFSFVFRIFLSIKTKHLQWFIQNLNSSTNSAKHVQISHLPDSWSVNWLFKFSNLF